MAKKQKYPIHEDFSHFPVIPFPMGRISGSLVNAFLHFDTWRQQRHVKAKAQVHQVDTGDGHKMKVYQFNPDNESGDTLPAIVYYHGGGYVLTYASTHVAAMDFYANELNCRVFMVDYRLMPKYPFPTGFNDCFKALKWVARQAGILKVDPERIAVMGDSAGGGMTANVAARAQDEGGPALAGQLMIYPTIDHTCGTASAQNFPDTPLWNSVGNKKMWECYLQNVDSNNPPPYAAAGTREDLSGLPPAYVDVAEYDPLRDEGTEYAKRLEAAGVPVEFHAPPGTIHGYDTVLTSDIVQDIIGKRIQFLNQVLNK